MTGQGREIIVTSAVAAIIALSIGLGVYYLQPQILGGGTTSSSVSSTRNVISSVSTSILTTASLQGCATEYSTSIVEGTKSNTSLIVFATNSTAKVCVTIYNPYNSNPGIGNWSWSGPSIVYMVQNGSLVSPVNLTVDIHPPNIQIAPGANASRIFEIIPQNGTRAIYDVYLPDPCTGIISPIPQYFILAVGYSAFELQAEHLNIPNQTYECGAFADQYASIVGISNLLPTYTK